MDDGQQPAPSGAAYLITEEQRNVLADYLARQPWREVNGLIAMLIQAPPATAPIQQGSEALAGRAALHLDG
jgi:hypothetical protein